MPNRIIKESICESRGLTSCSVFAEDLYKRLITYADDNGRFNADTEIMLARLYPRELAYVTQDDLIDALVELTGVGKIAFYTSQLFNSRAPNTGVYGCFPNWSEHQRVRDSKKKCPDPDDTAINDWYLRRFIPIDMKAQIIERDGFKCKICGKFVTTCRDAKRFVKLGTGMYHIDHIVPCGQGGRATYENLQLTCPTCNLSRKRRFSFDEIVAFAETGETSLQPAASCSLNPIQSNPNPNPIREKSGRFTPPSLDEVKAYCLEHGYGIDPEQFINYYDSNGWMVGKNKMKDWKATVRTWVNRDHASGKKTKPVTVSQHPTVPSTEETERLKRILESMKGEE